MTNVAEELASPAEGLSKDHVARRVQDWKNRISELYGNVAQWLPDGVMADGSHSVPMHEDLMRQFRLPATSVPILTLLKGDQWLGKLVPQGLWIIGANGRVDLFSPNGQSIIVDRSENFDRSNWLIAPSNQRRQTKPLAADTFKAALGI